MKPEHWEQIKQLYNSALELEPSQRDAFLRKAFAGGESLRKEIERLFAQQVEAEDVLGMPALEFAARALAQDRKDEPQPDYVGRSLLHYRLIGNCFQAAKRGQHGLAGEASGISPDVREGAAILGRILEEILDRGVKTLAQSRFAGRSYLKQSRSI